MDFNYKPDGQTLKSFLKSDNFFRGLRGPVDLANQLLVVLSYLEEHYNNKKALMDEESLAGLLLETRTLN